MTIPPALGHDETGCDAAVGARFIAPRFIAPRFIASAKRLARRVGFNRAAVASVRMCCERNVLATVRTPGPRKVGRILCYHSVGQPPWGVNDVSPRQLRRHLEIARAAGYRFVPASEIVRTGGGPRDLALTFDDGLKSVLTNAAPILAEFGAPWTLFVVSDWAEGRHQWDDDVLLGWGEIERLLAAGAEVGSHSVTHPNFAWLSPDEAADQLGRSRQTIEARLGVAPTTFAIPLGQSSNWTVANTAAAHAAGYTTIYAQAEETRPPGTVARTFMTRWDTDRVFRGALGGSFDHWEEWV